MHTRVGLLMFMQKKGLFNMNYFFCYHHCFGLEIANFLNILIQNDYFSIWELHCFCVCLKQAWTFLSDLLKGHKIDILILIYCSYNF